MGQMGRPSRVETSKEQHDYGHVFNFYFMERKSHFAKQNKMKIWILIKTQPVDFPIELKSNKNFYPGSLQLPTPGRRIPPFAGSAQSFAKV